MKAGVRALGIAESYRNDRSTLAGVVTRASRTVDGFAFSTCTVGGMDATDAIVDLVTDLGREDVRYVFIAGIALAWYNIVDLRRIHDAVERPILSITFEESTGLAQSLREEFDDEAFRERNDVYVAQPARRRLDLDGETVFVRAVGIDDDEADDVVRAFTPEGGRPEPLRVGRLAARAADRYVADH